MQYLPLTLIGGHFFSFNTLPLTFTLTCVLDLLLTRRTAWESSATLFPVFMQLSIFPGERVYDIAFWKSELNNEVNAMATEIENLKVKYKKNLSGQIQENQNNYCLEFI